MLWLTTPTGRMTCTSGSQAEIMPTPPDERTALPGPTKQDFPALYRGTDDVSRAGQSRFMWAMKVRLLGFFVAALGGFVSGFPDLRVTGAVTAFVALLFTVGAELYTHVTRPDRNWYEGRAAAESVKTLTWRYMVRGGGYELEGDADAIFSAELRGILKDLGSVPPAQADATQITPLMRRAREQNFDQRRDYYRAFRIQDQLAWYSSKAQFNETRGHAWTLLLVILEVAGLFAAAALAAEWITFDALGLISAAAAGAAAWAQARQHQTLSSAYSVTSQELADILTQLDSLSSESVWAQFVTEAEEAISREHTLWRASRGLRSTA